MSTLKTAAKKVLTNFRTRVRSRHPSHRAIRNLLPLLPFRSVIRMGSTTEIPNTVAQGGKTIELNTIEAIRNSANKRRMKDCFTLGGVRTADWFISDGKQLLQVVGAEKKPEPVAIDKLPYPIIAKHIYGSRGTGNYRLEDQAAVEAFLRNRAKDLEEFIFERYYNYALEYRLHITEDGCFYACRKALKKDVDKAKSWQRHDDNCVWFTEKVWVEGKETDQENPNFQKPSVWEAIVQECVKALNATEMDIASFDIRVQSSKTEEGKARKNVEFIILECNSASSFGDNAPNSLVAQRYLQVIPALARKKAVEYGIIKKA